MSLKPRSLVVTAAMFAMTGCAEFSLTGRVDSEIQPQPAASPEGFISMKESILREQMQMQKNWKEREKQIEKVLLNMSSFYGSVKGIAGSAIRTVKLLEGEE